MEAETIMSEEIIQPEQPKLPICPHCGHDPFNLMEVPLNNESGVTLITFSCADCRKLINVVILKLPPQRPPMVDVPRIVRPQ
jgi:hypothetical protein